MIGKVLSHPRVQVENVGDRVQNAALAQHVRILAEEVEADQEKRNAYEKIQIRLQGGTRAAAHTRKMHAHTYLMIRRR